MIERKSRLGHWTTVTKLSSKKYTQHNTTQHNTNPFYLSFLLPWMTTTNLEIYTPPPLSLTDPLRRIPLYSSNWSSWNSINTRWAASWKETWNVGFETITVEAVIEGNDPMDQDEVKFDIEEENRITKKWRNFSGLDWDW